MELSLSNGVFAKHSLEQNFKLINKLGFKNIEFNMKTVKREHEELIHQVKRLLKEYNLTCLTLHSATHYVGDEIEIPKAIYYGKVSIEFANRLQAPIMVVHSNVLRKLPDQSRLKIIKKIFQELVPYARDKGVTLALENLSYAARGFGKNADELEQILDTVNDETMGVTLDVSHALATGVLNSLIDNYHDRIYDIHLSNRMHKPFTAETPFLLKFLSDLHKYQYKGALTIEVNRKCAFEEVLKNKKIIEQILSSNK